MLIFFFLLSHANTFTIYDSFNFIFLYTHLINIIIYVYNCAKEIYLFKSLIHNVNQLTKRSVTTYVNIEELSFRCRDYSVHCPEYLITAKFDEFCTRRYCTYILKAPWIVKTTKATSGRARNAWRGVLAGSLVRAHYSLAAASFVSRG